MSPIRALPLLALSLVSQAVASNPAVRMQVCNDYHCDIRRPASLSAGQWRELQQLFSNVGDPIEERRRIGTAIGLLEQWVGEQTGSWRDLPRNEGEGTEAGQLDCIAESINTTTYLHLMTRHNLLKWHRADARQRRSAWIFNVHWTASIRETTTGQRFAVDSWFFANGTPPVIMPLEAWSRGLEQTLNKP
ncbi:MAG: hypothetical protein OQL28_02875 [Sedimenticola sp.]|nr:hypothetical protein [Sedimenticola sp.]